MKIIVTKNYDEMSKKAAELMAEIIKNKPACVLGLATGDTPIGMYNELVAKYEAGEIDFSAVRSMNLDEYYPISPDNDQSYRYFMNKHLFDRVNIDKANTSVPDGTAENVREFCSAYEAKLDELGGTDVQVLGIGRNGHIGFNEPDSVLVQDTHVTDLTEDTIDANSRFFESIDDVPRQAISMGIGSIMEARRVILVATGKDKAEAVYKMMKEPVTPHVPASVLQLHPDCIILVDEAAASLMK
mgnify:CR=1 FL=1